MHRSRVVVMAVAAGLIVAPLAAAAVPALAGPPWTAMVANGGAGLPATAPSGGSAESPLCSDARSSVTLKTTGTPGSSATVNAPSANRSASTQGAAWNGLATVTAFSLNGVQSNAGINFVVTPSGLPWSLNAVCNTTSGITKGTITGIKARLAQIASANYVDIGGYAPIAAPSKTSPNDSNLAVNGTVKKDASGNVAVSSQTTGSVTGYYNNSTKKLTITGSVNLVALSSNVGSTGIFWGAIKPGDVLDFKATYTLTSAQLSVITGGGVAC